MKLKISFPKKWEDSQRSQSFKIWNIIIKNLNEVEDIKLKNITPIFEYTSILNYVEFNFNNKNYFIILSSFKVVNKKIKNIDGRNSLIIQQVLPIIKQNFKDKNMYFMYISDSEAILKSDFHKLSSFILNYIGIKPLNNCVFHFTNKNKNYTNYDKYIKKKKEFRRKNPNTNPTKYIYNDKSIIIFAKLDGANKPDSIISTLFLKKNIEDLNKKIDIIFIPNYNNKISPSEKQILEKKGIIIKPFLEYENILNEVYSSIEVKENKLPNFRHQAKFKSDLLSLNEGSKCLVCDCQVENIVIASHIERVADIKNSTLYTKDEKIERTNDPYNGIILCRNHDKLFEDGKFFFDNNGKLHLNQSASENITQYMLDTINIEKEINFTFLPKMKKYFKKHRERNLIIENGWN